MKKMSARALGAFLLVSTPVAPSWAQREFDPSYLKIFASRPAASKGKVKYWIFDPSDLGGYIGCYRWGCKKGGQPLVGKRVVMIGKYAESPWGTADLSTGLLGIEPETMMGTLSLFTGSPPPLARAGPGVVASMRRQQTAKKCGRVSHCIAVFWGTIQHSSQPHGRSWWVPSSYYYLSVEGLKIYDKYTLLSAAKEGATVGWSQALSVIVSSGFQPTR